MDPMQQKMMQFMPLVFGVMMAFFPAGLVLYWVTNGGLGLLQQWLDAPRSTPSRRRRRWIETRTSTKPAARRASASGARIAARHLRTCAGHDARRPTDTIAAIATAPGAGGVGIVRLVRVRARARSRSSVCGKPLQPRAAHGTCVSSMATGRRSTTASRCRFPAPRSYTGEDVVELQAHGSPVVLQQLVARCLRAGRAPARPGEFSERAFLNGKLDLAQAEAVADLIAASDMRAARAARRALDGVFSRRVDALAAELLAMRVHVEAAIDFADEPLDTLGGAAAARAARRGASHCSTRCWPRPSAAASCATACMR